MNWNEMADRLGLEEDELFEMLQVFLEAGESDLEGIRDAMEANDPLRVAAHAHSIKGASLSFGFPEMVDKAKEIEAKARQGILDGECDAIVTLQAGLLEINSELRTRLEGPP